HRSSTTVGGCERRWRRGRAASWPRSPAKSSTRWATSSSGRGPRSSAPSARRRRTCTATSPRGITATPSSSGRYDPALAVRAAAMNDQPHYRFPPASAYRLNRCLFALKSDDAFRARFLKDARAAIPELELDAEDTAAVLQGDRDALLARGAPPTP